MAVKMNQVGADSKGDLFFGVKYQERLSCRTVEAAVWEQMRTWDCRAFGPVVLDMAQYSREEVRNIFLYEPLDRLIEVLEEDYGDSDGERTVVTDAMREAEKAFLAVVLNEYVPFLVQRDFDFGVVVLHPADECCTFLTGCCLDDGRTVTCSWHEGIEDGI